MSIIHCNFVDSEWIFSFLQLILVYFELNKYEENIIFHFNRMFGLLCFASKRSTWESVRENERRQRYQSVL